jgi:RNA polymerase sigma-70 factor (ECF subfamily)
MDELRRSQGAGVLVLGTLGLTPPAREANDSATSRSTPRPGAEVAEPESLECIVRRAQLRDQHAVEALIAQIRPVLRRTVRSVRGGTSVDEEDIVQESLLALLKGLGAFRGESSIVRYAQRIAVRVALPERRRHVARLKHTERYAREWDVRSDREPTDAVVRGQRRALMRELLDSLPPPQAEALAHRVIYGATLQEIAEESGVPVNTVRTRLRLAREALAKRLRDVPELVALLRGGR